MAKISGGGITSNKLVTSKGYKVEPVARGASPAGVSQMGVSTAFRKEPLIQGPRYNPAPVPPTGIANACKGPAGAAPGGGGRTIYKSGSQSPTPTVSKPVGGRDILSSFGPERFEKERGGR